MPTRPSRKWACCFRLRWAAKLPGLFRKVAAIPVMGSGKVDLKAVQAFAMEQVKSEAVLQ